jgi:hydrogenase-4 component E
MTSLAQGSAGLALVLSFALLCPRQVGTALRLLTAQTAAVTVAALADADWVAGAVWFACGTVAAPLLLRRLLSGLDLPYTTLPAGGSALVLLVAGALTALAMSMGPLGLPLAILLLGVLLVATRRHPAMHVIGLLAMQNGLVLAAAGSSLAAGGAAALPVVPALAGAALWLRRSAARSAVP